MRIFTLPPTAGSSPEPNFYDSLQKVRLRQQLEMYSLGEDACGLMWIAVKLDLTLQYCAKVLTRKMGNKGRIWVFPFSFTYCPYFSLPLLLVKIQGPTPHHAEICHVFS